MERMRIEYPDEYATLAYRAITNRRLQKLIFRAVIVAELVAVLALWSGTGALFLTLFGDTAPYTAQLLALFGAIALSAIWAAMLVVGNHFSYWLCHEGAQTTHFHMTLWGLGTMNLLIVGKA